MIVLETTTHAPNADIFKLLKVEGFQVDLKILYTDNPSIRLLFSTKRFRYRILESSVKHTSWNKKKSENQYKPNEYQAQCDNLKRYVFLKH